MEQPSKKRKLREVTGQVMEPPPHLAKRRRFSASDVISFLRRQITEGAPVTNRRPSKSQGISSFPDLFKSKGTKYLLRRQHSISMEALVIFMRFGSLTNDNHKWLTATEVFKRTGVKIKTQWSMVNRWRKRGFIIERRKPQGRPRMLTKEQVQWITDNSTLQSMSHLCLAKRARLIKEHFQLPSFSDNTL